MDPSRAHHDLSHSDVRDALRLNTPALVAEVMTFARTTVSEESARQTRIDSKANLLLGALGISITVTTAVLPHMKGVGAGWLLGAAAVSLVAGIHAVWALRVTTLERVGDRTIFDKSVLETADKATSAEAVAVYQRYLLAAMWDSHVLVVRSNDDRARVLSRGQGLFVVALFLAVIGGTCFIASGRAAAVVPSAAAP